jgi:alpha-mannosidase
MKPGNSTVNKLDYTSSRISVLAAGQIDAPGLGIANQDGDSYFENFFALKPNRNGHDPSTAMKFSLEHQNPLVAGKISGRSASYGSHFSLLTISDPDVLVWSVKPSEEGIGAGVILRIWNMSNKESNCTISFVNKIIKCYETSHIETNISEMAHGSEKLNLELGHNRIHTFRISLK